MTFSALAELILRLEVSLEEPWSLARMAKRTGFGAHHIAHAFRDAFGIPPMAYVRRLRLERAAYELVVFEERPLEQIAARAGYDSPIAFHRAFGRAFAVTPSRLRSAEGSVRRLGRKPPLPAATPKVLHPNLGPPEVVQVAPRFAVSLRARSPGLRELAEVWLRFTAMVEDVSRPWQRGLTSSPHGWVTRSEFREFRCVALADAPPRNLKPPLEPWRMSAAWCACFPFEGDSWRISDAFDWIFRSWMAASGLRFAFAPTLTLFDEMKSLASPGAQVRARIFIPVMPLELGPRGTLGF